ncbi:MAG TPA: M20 aminoacylase family protein [Stellaceae bacterium]|nr:M20 aminoacylase family protein [Stellaceae bacterium]
MSLIPELVAAKAELTEWRRDLHAHPELAYDEHRTSDIVAERLASFGLQVTRGIAKTGVVGSLRVGNGHRAIGLRADMDALPLHEKNEFAHRSRNEGRMHACGHDGHTTILLGAARHLARTRNFDGTVHFIFQPAEEGGGGGKLMVEEGLFERFPVDGVYGLHNAPRHPAGKFFTRPGPVMAAAASFDLHIQGRGGHAARPEGVLDPVVAAAHVVTALQTVVSRAVSPFDTAVVSITKIHGGDAYNIIPEDVTISGNCRAYRTEVMNRIEATIRRVAENAAAAHGAGAKLDFRRGYPPLVNHARETEIACNAAALTVGEENVDRNGAPRMASEDFSYMLEARPGAFIFLGNGDGEGSCDVHNPRYDFNDEILPVGASYFANLVEMVLAKDRE